jgi:isoquinoline 1-oxidoreductase subunit beta
MSRLRVSRRTLLGCTAGITVTVLPTLAGCSALGIPVIPKRPQPKASEAMAWLHHAQGITTLHLPRVEMGQNIGTALKQIVCLEMGVAWPTVRTRLHSTANIPRVKATVGSDSIKDFAVPLAQACATLRDALASGQMQGKLDVLPRPVSQLRAFQQVSTLPTPPTPLIEEGLAIVRGEPLYVADVRLPGMVFGRVLRAAASPEIASTLAQANEAAARAVPGFVALVRDPLLTVGRAQGVGIVAQTPGALDRIEQALAPHWAVAAGFEQHDVDAAIDIDARYAKTSTLAHRIHNDTLSSAGTWDVDIRLDVPLAAHTPIEPRAAVAAFGDKTANSPVTLQLWVGSQDVFYQRDVVAQRLGLREDQVVVHGQRVGGAFGGKTICTVELEAAVLARATNRPVKVQWSRAQEFQQGFHRPPSSHRVRASVKDGRLQEWWHGFASSHILFTAAVLPPWLQKLTGLIGDDGVARGATLPYRTHARRTEFDLVRLPVHTGPWRGLGAGPNVWAMETAIDQCARRADADPVAFRLAHSEDQRLAGVLKAVAGAAQWAQPVAAQPGAATVRGRGVACGIYKASSYAAVVADVEVDPRSGQVRVLRLWCAHDCGWVINASHVRAQCEGNLVWGLGMALLEQLPLANGQVAASSLADSPVPRFVDVPPMQVLLVPSTAAPSGAGETAIVAAAAAISNAVLSVVPSRAAPTRALRLPLQAQAVRAMFAVGG